MDALQKLDDGRLVFQTPPDPRTGTTMLTLGPLEWIHRITAHIPDIRWPTTHLIRSLCYLW